MYFILANVEEDRSFEYHGSHYGARNGDEKAIGDGKPMDNRWTLIFHVHVESGRPCDISNDKFGLIGYIEFRIIV